MWTDRVWVILKLHQEKVDARGRSVWLAALINFSIFGGGGRIWCVVDHGCVVGAGKGLKNPQFGSTPPQSWSRKPQGSHIKVPNRRLPASMMFGSQRVPQATNLLSRMFTFVKGSRRTMHLYFQLFTNQTNIKGSQSAELSRWGLVTILTNGCFWLLGKFAPCFFYTPAVLNVFVDACQKCCVSPFSPPIALFELLTFQLFSFYLWHPHRIFVQRQLFFFFFASSVMVFYGTLAWKQ